MSFRRACLLGLALLSLGGCKSCRNEHPYVPYSIEEAGVALPSIEDASVVAPEDAGGHFSERHALQAPPDATDWALEGLHLVAPPDRVFVLGLVSDFDGDGAPDALAIVRGHDALDLGEVVLYKGAAGAQLDRPVTVAAPPPVPPGDPTCSALRRLGQIGHHSAVVELGLACAGHGTDAPSRWIAIVSSVRGWRVRFSAVIVDPPAAPTLSFDADGADFDGDGIDDVALRVTLEGGGPPFEPGPKVSTTVRWLDRPAGMSRDPDEPEASLRMMASVALARAGRVKEAPAVPITVHQIRALYAAICAEGGAPRVRMQGARAAVACGTSRALEEAGLAEARAFATMGDPLRAIAALDRAELAPATHNPQRVTEAESWIAQSVPTAKATTMRTIAAIPQIERARAPAWGALAFEASGKVLVRTPAGVVRVDPLQGDEAQADDVTAWPSKLLSPDGALRWIEAYDACDAFALHATFAPTNDADPRDVTLPVAARLGARCAGSKGEPAHASPIAWGALGLEAIVAGEPVLIAPDYARATPLAAPLGQPVTLGAPRSPDGKTLVVATSHGILARGAKTRLLKATELDGAYLELRDCAVSDDGARVACVRGGRAFVGLWEPQ